MDRRQQKTREAIFSAFSKLLSEKNYHQISVQEIIDNANVGRTTFYSHFETKDYLLKELCDELFNHIIDTAMGQPHGDHQHEGKDQDSIFLHLIRHLQENDRNVLGLLSSDNNEIFLKYFKDDLKRLVITQYADRGVLKADKLPEDYVVNHISSSFVETVSWWLLHSMQETELLMQGLKDSGCSEEAAARICSLRSAGDYEGMLHQMKIQRCTLVEEMHESQKKVDRMDYLIHMQEKRMN